REDDCEAFGLCGGRALRHLSYESELTAKRNFVQDAFKRLGGFSLDIPPCTPSPEIDRYRNKVQYPLTTTPSGRVTYGFYATRSHRVVSCADCRLQPTVLNEIAAFLCQLFTAYSITVYDERTHKGTLRHLYLRRGAHSGEIMVCIVVNGNGVSGEIEIVKELTEQYPDVKTVLINSNREDTNIVLGRKFRTIWGDGFIHDTLCDIPVTLAAPSFYQVNTPGAEKLYALAAEFASPTPDDLLLDLYCGTGTIGLSMAHRVKQLVGVEIVPEAVQDAEQNARAAKITNATFFAADAAAAADKMAEEGLLPSIIVLDPPRKGCEDATLAAVLKMAPKKIVMVSCNAATAARDAKHLAAHGYALKKVQPLDMFPRTKHVECVTLLVKE
ncbi:MAG: 23S rRNA (uracil(1939)-C(5))-methyltransferase RlmD, partial [Pygmaiobacter sp.]